MYQNIKLLKATWNWLTQPIFKNEGGSHV